jgi:hypothetical protein
MHVLARSARSDAAPTEPLDGGCSFRQRPFPLQLLQLVLHVLLHRRQLLLERLLERSSSGKQSGVCLSPTQVLAVATLPQVRYDAAQTLTSVCCFSCWAMA